MDHESETGPWDPGEWVDVPVPDLDEAPGVSWRRRRRSRVVVIGVALAVLMAGAVVAPLTAGGRSAGAAMRAAVTSTLGQRTADVTMTGTVSSGPATFRVTGTGQVDFSARASSLTGGTTVAGHRTVTDEITVGGTVYEKLPGIARVEPGKTWVSLQVSSIGAGSSSGSPTGSLGATTDPMGILQLLQRSGGTVQSLGTSTQDGTTVQGYKVVLDRTAIEADLGKADLPAWLRTAVASVDFGDLDLTVYVEGNGFLRSIGVSVRASVSKTPIDVDETLRFSTYGAVVSIQAPPATSVVTLQQFLRTVAASGSPSQD